jgi:hypothetical protein
VHPVSSEALRNLMSGVLPTASMKSERKSMTQSLRVQLRFSASLAPSHSDGVFTGP